MDILHKFDDELPIAFSEEMGYNILENQKKRSRGAVYRKPNTGLNKTMGCKSPRCRRCKCPDNLPLTEVSH